MAGSEESGGAGRDPALQRLAEEVHRCRRCPRLVAWREEQAADPPRRHRGERYWARPLEGFGDPGARVVVIGLAPAAHGGNRTGRFFTGDRSGDWLFGSLHRTGFANQPRSEHREDGLRLRDAYVSAVNRCPPPANRPTPEERDNCLPYLERELRLLDRRRVLVALGSYAWDGTLGRCGRSARRCRGRSRASGTARSAPSASWSLIGCYHPSQQNTFTGTLTEAMLDAVFDRAQQLAAGRG